MTSKEELCGHVNQHSIGLDRKLSKLKCVLPAGHKGDHEAPYETLGYASPETPPEKIFKKGGKEYARVIEQAYWSDDAGTPVPTE